jgi:hypothetical protein
MLISSARPGHLLPRKNVLISLSTREDVYNKPQRQSQCYTYTEPSVKAETLALDNTEHYWNTGLH